MKYSVTTTEKNGILQACERYTRLGDAGISGVTANLAEFTNYINEELRTIWALIHRVYGGWQYEDFNQTDLPAAVASITANQTSYALPVGTLNVRGIEVKDTGGVWHQLRPITEEMIREKQAMGEFHKVPSRPIYYQLLGNSVRIFPASDYTQADSFKVFYDRGSVAFTTADTTEEPGFVSEFHDVIPLGASIKWFGINTPEDLSLPFLTAEYKRKLADLEKFYQTQYRQLFPIKARRLQTSFR